MSDDHAESSRPAVERLVRAIRRARMANNWSHEGLAQKAALDLAIVQRIESGLVQPEVIDVLSLLSPLGLADPATLQRIVHGQKRA